MTITWHRLVLAVLSAGATAMAGQWQPMNDGLRNLTVNGVSISPSSPNILYLQARGLGVYKSVDSGATWTKTTTFNNNNGPGFDHLIHDGPAIHPTNPDIVWVASGGQIYKTVNGGTSWTLSSTGTTVNNCNGVHGIIVDPTDHDHLFAGTIATGCDGGVFESVNGGATWTHLAGSPIGGGIGNDAWPLRINPVETNRLYAGSPHNAIYRSSNGGTSWSNTPPVAGDHSTYEIAVNPALPSNVWCIEVGGTWLSTNHGANWTRQTHLFNDSAVAAMRFAPSDAQIAYAIVGDTVWRSSDNGVNWLPRGMLIGGPRCVEIDPSNPDIVYVGTAGLGMFKSIDGGQTFSEINSGLPMTALIRGWQVFGDPLLPGGMYCVLEGNTVYHRASDATPWQYHTVLPGGGLPYVQIERHRPNRWFFADGGLWRSLDSGITWEEIYSNGADTSVVDYWLDPRQCGRILLSDRDGFRIAASDNGGDSWATVGILPSFNGFIGGITGDPFDPDVILVTAAPPHHAAGQTGYIWRSANGGQSWQHIRDRMFYGDWRIGIGYWRMPNNVMRQDQPCCTNYHVNLDHHTFANGSYECGIRILASDQNITDYWAGFTIRTPTADSNWLTGGGWLVYLRRNGALALHNKDDGTVINADQTPIVGDTSQWTTVRLDANGNQFSLYANNQLVGSYTDPHNRYNAPGYFALQTNRTQSEFDNLNIQAETTYTDSFSQTNLFGAYWGRWVSADPHNPGRFAYATQWGGLWHSIDHGQSWQRISPDSRNGYLMYRPLFSTQKSGNLYVNSGTGFSWRVDNYYDDAASRQQIGQNLSYSTWLLGEDPHDGDTLYAPIYDLGITRYHDNDIIGDAAPPIPVRLDFDGDGDIDQSDFGRLQACYTGPGVPVTDPICTAMQIDVDNDVDQEDVTSFFECMTAPNIEPNPACDCDRE